MKFCRKWQMIRKWEYFRLLLWLIKGLTMPARRINFMAYLIVGVILCGGSGIWLSLLYKTSGDNLHESIITALCSYATATMGTAFIEFIAFESSEGDRPAFLKGYSVLVSACVAVLSVIAVARGSANYAIGAAVVSIMYLWTTNADRMNPSPSPKPDGGGGENLVNVAVSGSTKGYST